MRGFCLLHEVYGKQLVFLLRGIFMCLVHPVLTILGKILQPLVFVNVQSLGKAGEYNRVARAL
jgi:hypothetical protein